MFGRIHHVAIICSDYERSKHFYVKLLGFSIVKETLRKERQSYKLDLEKDGVHLELFSFPSPPKRITDPEACGLRHLALEVENVDMVKQELERRGVIVQDVRIDEITNKRFTFFNDPDGLPLEIYEK